MPWQPKQLIEEVRPSLVLHFVKFLTRGPNVSGDTFCKADTVEILDLHSCLLQGILDYGVYPLPVMSRSILR